MSFDPEDNQTANAADTVIQRLIFDVALQAAMAAAIADSPWLGLPVIKQLLSSLLQVVAGYIYKALAVHVSFAIINAQTLAEQKDFEASTSALAEAFKKGDDNEIQVATDNVKRALRSLIGWDGDASAGVQGR